MKSIIVKFSQAADQTDGCVTRIVGFVQAKHMLGIFDNVDLEANPRSAKVGNVTSDIIESIEDSTEIFPFKTKGVLLGASRYEALQRKRFKLEFEDTEVEGILDGGHNMLAIGIYILSQVILDEREIKRIKNWSGLKGLWQKYRDDIEEVKDLLEFFVPLEILVPADLKDDSIVAEFNTSLLDICAARNNNVQLTLETKANKKGFYDEIRNFLPHQISEKVEWKTNDGGLIKVRDLIALSWIPLNKLNSEKLLPIDVSVSPQNIYRNKGECTKQFDKLMNHPEVSKSPDGNYGHTLQNNKVQSALKILADLPELYDQIYTNFPEAYNEATGGRFGRNPIVKMYEPAKKGDKSGKYLRTQPKSKFTNQPTKYKYPDALIMPLVYGLSALMEINNSQELIWKTNPKKFLNQWLKDISRSYKLVLDMSNFDPQKVGKNETSYEIAINQFQGSLLKQTAGLGE